MVASAFRTLIGFLVMATSILVAPAFAVAHHMVLPFNLEEMVVTADRVFVGRCVAVNPTADTIAQGVLPVTRYTFEVERVIKGDVPSTFTFTQLGHPARVLAKRPATTLVLHGMTEYVVGDRLILFLVPNYLGGAVTYPVGLDQGMFALGDGDGATGTRVRNGRGNAGLFRTRYTGDYGPGGMPSSRARVIHPERPDPLAGAALSPAAKALESAGDAMPLAALVELVGYIHAAHGGNAGGKGARP